MKHLPGALKTFGYCYHLLEDVFIGYSNETLTSVVRSHPSLNDIIINSKRFFENKPLVFFFFLHQSCPGLDVCVPSTMQAVLTEQRIFPLIFISTIRQIFCLSPLTGI